jgi:outer membrane protein TolC
MQNVLALALRHQVGEASEASTTQRWNEHSTREAVPLAVIEGYLQVLEVEARLDAARTALQLVEARFANGLSSNIDIVSAQEALAAA